MAVLFGGAPGAFSQPLELKSPPKPSKAPPSPDRDLRPSQPPVPMDPAYVPKLSLSDEGRSRKMGAAAWTTSNPPVGSLGAASPESRGSVGFGFAVEWF